MRPEPLILAFDTSAAHCAAALLSGDRVLEARAEDMAKGQAERLFPMLEEMLARHGAGWRDLAAIGVGIGPGNFTGVRISVAAARGLALSLGVPALGVSRLEALAHGLPRPVVAAEDARRGEVYCQGFGPDNGSLIVPTDDMSTCRVAKKSLGNIGADRNVQTFCPLPCTCKGLISPAWLVVTISYGPPAFAGG